MNAPLKILLLLIFSARLSWAPIPVDTWKQWMSSVETKTQLNRGSYEYETKPMLERYKTIDKEKHIVYYGPDSKAVIDRHRVRIRNGRLYDIDGEPITTDDAPIEWNGIKIQNRHLYIMDKKGNLFIGRHVINHFHHSSIVGGGDVAAAGLIGIQNGRLVYIDNQSGHYTPDQHFLAQALVSLKRQGVDLNGVEVLLRTNETKTEKTVLHGMDPPPQPASLLEKCFRSLLSVAGG